MCVLFIAKNVSKQYPLIIIANRDEFYQRPTTAIKHWAKSPIIAGQDLEAGGTWLGITANGKVAALTNIRDPQRVNPDAISRGNLVSHFLTSSDSTNAIKAQLLSSADSYNGYNLLFGDKEQLQVFNSASRQFSTVGPGIHGLSNAQFNAPWPKVVLGKKLLTDYLTGNESIEGSALVAILQNSQQADDDSLPATGIPLDIERALSPLFIHNKARNYGTRCTSVLLFSASGAIDFHETSYDSLGQITTKAHFSA